MKRWAVLMLGLCACARHGEPVQSALPESMPPQAVSVEVVPPLEVAATPARLSEAEPAPPTVVSSRVVFDPPGSTSIQDVRNITFEVDVTGARPGAELSLELVANQTVDYQRQVVTLQLGPTLTQHHAFDLPVAGTMIHMSQLSGTWNATFLIDDVELSSQTFGLAP